MTLIGSNGEKQREMFVWGRKKRSERSSFHSPINENEVKIEEFILLFSSSVVP
jgi:hypothetical protein